MMKTPSSFGTQTGEDRAVVDGIEFSKGQKLRLTLHKQPADSHDLMFDGLVATLEKIYRDSDDKVYLAVTLDDDPAQAMQRDLARYLFFLPDQVEIEIPHARLGEKANESSFFKATQV